MAFRLTIGKELGKNITWGWQTRDKLISALEDDRYAGNRRTVFSKILPNTQLEIDLILQELWQYYSVFSGDLAFDLLSATRKEMPENYFSYNFNGIFSFVAGLIPLFEPAELYVDYVRSKNGLLKLLQSNADLLTILNGDAKTERWRILQEVSQGFDSEKGRKTRLAHSVSMNNSNQNIDRLLAQLRTSNLLIMEDQIEKELIRKTTEGTYLTLDTIRDSFPEWTTFQTAHSISYPASSECEVRNLCFYQATDGATHPSRSDTRDLREVSTQEEVLNAAEWQDAFEERNTRSTNKFGKEDDASQLRIKFIPNPQWSYHRG